jgi:hypothetical protein
MQLESVRTYLFKLIQDGQKWQYIDINGKGKKPSYYFTSVQWVLLLLSIITFYFLKKGLNNDFVGYIINALSIFVGLFLTLILAVFDKFKGLEKISQPTETDKLYLIQRTNFFKQFTSLTGYAIIIAILCILLLSITFATEIFKLNIFHDSLFVPSFFSFSINCYLFLSALYNITVIYFLLDFLLIVIYAVTAMHTYMMIEYNKK